MTLTNNCQAIEAYRKSNKSFPAVPAVRRKKNPNTQGLLLFYLTFIHLLRPRWICTKQAPTPVERLLKCRFRLLGSSISPFLFHLQKKNKRHPTWKEETSPTSTRQPARRRVVKGDTLNAESSNRAIRIMWQPSFKEISGLLRSSASSLLSFTTCQQGFWQRWRAALTGLNICTFRRRLFVARGRQDDKPPLLSSFPGRLSPLFFPRLGLEEGRGLREAGSIFSLNRFQSDRNQHFVVCGLQKKKTWRGLNDGRVLAK